MTVEPQHAYTVCIRAVMPQGKRTLADVQAPIRARFGGKMPSVADLCRMEQRAPGAFREYQKPQDNPGTQAALDAIRAKGEATRASILAVMTQPLTCVDISTALKRTHQLINRHLVLLAEQGKVTCEKVKGVKVWHRVPEAAE